MKAQRRVIIAVGLLGAGAATVWFYQRAEAAGAPTYRYAKVEVASVMSTVSATGSLSAVRTVDVGTQVSGQVSALLADFNDHVKKGQLIARIDPFLLQQAVRDAEAGVARADAQHTQAKLDFDRVSALHDKQVTTDAEFNASQSTYAVAKANLTSARIAYDKAEQNLSYANITSPIDGVIVQRSVDVGQTVAASFSSPTLFVIANDLSQMQMLAAVDESDIGRIHEGQDVTFTVSSYVNRTFRGRVRQVRLNATTTNNVVNYTVIVSVPNPDGVLLPGMTATARFVVAEAANVLTVPNAALRFRPASAADAPQRSASDSTGTIWVRGADGNPLSRRVRIGLADGTRVQVSGEGVTDGLEVIVAEGATGTTPNASATRSPLQPAATQGGPRGPF